jgi:hypothetical protein
MKLLAASAAVVALLMVALSPRGGELEPIDDGGGESYFAKPVELFDDRWRAAGLVMLLAAMLEKAMPAEPVVAAPPDPPALKVAAAEPIARPALAARALDVCQRHRMHKVFIRGGRSWRCRK